VRQSYLAARAEVAGAAQVLDLLNCGAADRAGPARGGAVEQAPVAARPAKEVDLVVATAAAMAACTVAAMAS